MAKAVLENILKQVDTLSHEELAELQHKLDALMEATSGDDWEQKLQRNLMESGLLSEMRKPLQGDTVHHKRQPVRVEGKALSEAIIEDRR